MKRREKKHYKPRQGGYVAVEKVQEIIQREGDTEATYNGIPNSVLWPLAIETTFAFGLRIHEAIGESPYKEKPGMRPKDIDAIAPEAEGLNCKHTIRIWRKRDKFEVLPVPDDLYTKLREYIKKYRIKPEQRLFPRHRTTVYQHLAKHGRTINEKWPIGCHVLRRSRGVHLRSLGMQMEDLQKLYSHENLSQTMQYIGVDKRRAFNNFSKFNTGGLTHE